ncbi:RING finger domain-containing protein [Erpetoichthys calabaricus]|uniref:RING finger domain-containing protein n=1 Tax=Erpetoichthys calabaricus TaxID=27687 RepID=UPI00223456BF|nr:RING finger domain-containing protein [Erpetoichthys calabaricus]
MAGIPGAISDSNNNNNYYGSKLDGLDVSELECPICYHEYNAGPKCPRVLECYHVFCTECLQKIQLSMQIPGQSSPFLIPCPLCRHPTQLRIGGALSLPVHSQIFSQLPPLAFHLNPSSRLATVTQHVVVSLDAADARFIILPTVSLRVEQRRALRTEQERDGSTAVGREEPISLQNPVPPPVARTVMLQKRRRALFFVKCISVMFWIILIIVSVLSIVHGPSLFNG